MIDICRFNAAFVASKISGLKPLNRFWLLHFYEDVRANAPSRPELTKILYQNIPLFIVTISSLKARKY